MLRNRGPAWPESATNQAYAYDAAGNRTSLSIGANTYAYTYPTTSNRLSATAGPVARSFSYDAAGNITGDGARTFVYDDRGRLRQALQSAGTTTYALNGLGQRVEKNGPLVPYAPIQFAYDAAGRLVGGYWQHGVVLQELVFLGDIPVALINRSVLEVGVDNASPEAAAVGTWSTSSAIAGFMGPNYREKPAGSGSASFTWTPSLPLATAYAVHARWTAAPERASNAPYTVHHAGGATTVPVNQRLSGGEWNLLGVFNLAPGQNHRVVLTDAADGVVVADAVNFQPVDQATMRYYVHADHLGTPLAILDQANQLRWRWDSAPFGESPADENPSGLGAFAFHGRFPGQYFDKETNLHYNMERDYWPEGGRYIQSDPIGLYGGINTYAYVGGNPISYTDPLGLQVIPAPPPRFPPPGGSGGQGSKSPGDPMYPPGMDPNQPRPPTYPEVRIPPFPPSSPPPDRRSICEHLFNQCIKGAEVCPPPITQVGRAFCLAAYIICITISGSGGSGGDPAGAP